VEKDDKEILLKEIEDLREQVTDLRRRLRPTQEDVLSMIRRRKVITLTELRKEFPQLWGGSLTRLFQELFSSDRYRVIRSLGGRKVSTVIAYFQTNSIPGDPSLLAFDYFQRIPLGKVEVKVSDLGKRYRELVGKQGSFEGIMETYNLDRDKAYEVWTEVDRLFRDRIEFSKNGKKAFRRKY